MSVETYLGDAVYASFDGYQICLRTGDGNDQRIYLEPSVLDALYRYVEKLQAEAEARVKTKLETEADRADARTEAAERRAEQRREEGWR